jgi:DNA-binding transcriptional ArsR family regulator
MYSITPSVMVRWLRAAGEGSRLRLLALCTQGPMSVSELAETLRQSEPRVSRHLKILSEAGLIERHRQGQWVQYRVAADPQAASFVAGLLAQLDRRDALLLADRATARGTQRAQGAALVRESRLGRALGQLISAAAPTESTRSALVAGVTHPELLEAAAGITRSCVALAPSRRAARAARAYVERRGFPCRVLEARGAAGVAPEDLGRAGGPFDLIFLDRPGAQADELAAVLPLVRAALTPHGRLWLFEGYEALEHMGQRVVEHPLARLRRVLSEAGLLCERLSPLEADGEHVIAAVARPALEVHSRSTERA